ncbi:MAG: hypothetical protein KTR30_29915 [Saprospiraceae bacterium]|nr:hypothetical protein [Saprospiraceae bacterium]
MMNKKTLLFSTFFLLFFGLSFLNFSTIKHSKSLEMVEQQFQTGLTELKTQIAVYHQLAEQTATSPTYLKQLQQAHLETRLSFKKVEFLLEYLDHPSIKRQLNGAPLPSVEPKVAEINVLEPIGLQVLDELVFGEDPLAETEELVRLTGALAKGFSGIYNYQYNIPINHRHIFESIRFELIRIISLGLTGFDTPGSANAIPEAEAALGSIYNAYLAYQPIIKNKDEALANRIVQTFESGIQYLGEHTDFEAFDRLHFLTSYINPLFKDILKAHKSTGIETIAEVNPMPQPFNYEAESVFDQDLLNPSFYAGFNLEEAKEKKRVELGKLLFFDPILSGNNERSCASCHKPEMAFTDGLKTSLAANGEGHILRNSPTIINAVFAEKYFYDLREEFLERQMKHVVLDALEFDTDFFEITEKLEQSTEYQERFQEAYPRYEISKWSVSNALSAYVASLVSYNSPFDQYVKGDKEAISPAAIRGFNLFMGKGACATCHFTPTFSGLVPPRFRESESEVLGVPHSPDTLQLALDGDPGRAANGRALDETEFYLFSFKTPTLRNIALTAPYMHNGVYQTLEEVMDFYNKGGGAGMGLDLPYQTLPDTPLNLTAVEIGDMITFMETLTDTTGLTARPSVLPKFEQKPGWNKRTIGGTY